MSACGAAFGGGALQKLHRSHKRSYLEYECLWNHPRMLTCFLLAYAETNLSLSLICRPVPPVPLSEATHGASFNMSQSPLMRLKPLRGKAQQSTVFSGVSLNNPDGGNKDPKTQSYWTSCAGRHLLSATLFDWGFDQREVRKSSWSTGTL